MPTRWSSRGSRSRELVAGSLLADAPIVAVSSKTGAGLDALRDGARGASPRVRRRGPTTGRRGCRSIACSRCKGFGTVVTGTLVSGTIREDDELTALPRARP